MHRENLVIPIHNTLPMHQLLCSGTQTDGFRLSSVFNQTISSRLIKPAIFGWTKAKCIYSRCHNEHKTHFIEKMAGVFCCCSIIKCTSLVGIKHGLRYFIFLLRYFTLRTKTLDGLWTVVHDFRNTCHQNDRTNHASALQRFQVIWILWHF